MSPDRSWSEAASRGALGPNDATATGHVGAAEAGSVPCGLLGAVLLLGVCVAAHAAMVPGADWWCAASGGGGLGAAVGAWLLYRHRGRTPPALVSPPLDEAGGDVAAADFGLGGKMSATCTGPQGVLQVDTRDHAALVSASFIELVGRADTRLRHLHGVASLFEPADRDRFSATYRLLVSGYARRASGRFRLRTECGARSSLQCRFDVLERDPDGRRARVLVVATDIGAWRRAENGLRRTALRDPLTGLSNRAALLRWQPSHPDTVNALILVGLDGFRRVNDRHGPAVGDACLIEVARRLQGAVRRGDLVARTADDEFVVMPASRLDIATLKDVAERLSRRLNAPFTIKGRHIPTGVRVSAAVGAPSTRPQSDALYATAKTALYRAKTRCRPWYVVTMWQVPG